MKCPYCGKDADPKKEFFLEYVGKTMSMDLDIYY